MREENPMAGDDSAVVRRAMTDDGRPAAELIQMYRVGPERLRELVSDMSHEQLRARPVPGKMSTLEVVCHVVDADQFLADRMKRTAATDKPLLLGVDSTTYLESLHYHDRDLQLQLALLDVTRWQMAEDLERLADEAWSREAVHSETGLVTLRQLLWHAIRHLDRHGEAIAEKRTALGL
jgi:uncharacterized damage-inducible protein DinB